MIVQKQDN